MVFIPTYLYIKQHSITGKLYFGKCTREESKMLIYKGSGVRWISHYKKHGGNKVVTLWYKLYDNIFDLYADAISMSKSFDIINNNSWLNLIIENGLDGLPVGNKVGCRFQKGRVVSKETCKNISLSVSGKNHRLYGVTGKDNPSFGKKQSKELIDKRFKSIRLLHDYLMPNGDIIYKISCLELAKSYNLNKGSLKGAGYIGIQYKGIYRIYTHLPENYFKRSMA